MMRRTKEMKSFSERIKDKVKRRNSNFVGMHEGLNEPDVDTIQDKREWEFRIAIRPDNAQKMRYIAEEVWAKVCEDEMLDFKFLLLEAPEQDTSEKINWDGTCTQLDVQGGSTADRDQRGKEFCVYMRWNGKAYERTPEQWKEFMLKCWKALIDAGINGIGYTAPPPGDREVKAQSGLATPFSYRSFSPDEGRYRFIDRWNPYRHSDPLEGICITVDDLRQNDIAPLLADKMLDERIRYLHRHQQEAQVSILAELKEIKDQAPLTNDLTRILDYLEALIKEAKDDVSLRAILRENQHHLSEIIQLIPRQCEPEKAAPSLKYRHLYYLPVVDDLVNQWENFLKDKISSDSILHAIKKIRFFNGERDSKEMSEMKLYPMEMEGRKKMLDEIVNDFKKNEKAAAFLVENKIDDIELKKMVEKNPSKMQLIRCHIEFYEKEKSALLRERKRAEEGKFRKTIDHFVNQAFEKQKDALHQENLLIKRIKSEMPVDRFKSNIKKQLDVCNSSKFKKEYDLIVFKLESVTNYNSACEFATWLKEFSSDKRFNPALFPGLFGENSLNVNIKLIKQVVDVEIAFLDRQMVINEIKIVPKDKILRHVFANLGSPLEKTLEVLLWGTYAAMDGIDKIEKRIFLLNAEKKALELKILNLPAGSDSKEIATNTERGQLLNEMEALNDQSRALFEEKQSYPKISVQEREMIAAYRSVFQSGTVYMDKALNFVDQYMSDNEALLETVRRVVHSAIADLKLASPGDDKLSVSSSFLPEEKKSPGKKA